MFFGRDEIHIQAFANVFMEKLLFVNPHLHKLIFEICNQLSTTKWKIGQIENIWY